MPIPKYNPDERTLDQVQKAFEVVEFDGDQPERVHALRSAFRNLAYQVALNCPSSRGTSLALTNLEQACHWAVSAIAHEE